MKTFKKVLLGLIALGLVLVLGFFILVKVAFPPSKVRALVHQHGSKALNREVTVDRVSVRVFPQLKLVIKELNVANAPGFSAEPVIKLREVGLSLPLLPLLRMAPVIDEIRLVEPEILFEVDAAGRNNFEGLGGNDSTWAPDTAKVLESPMAVALKRFAIQNGKFRYKDHQEKRELVLGRINQNVSLSIDQRLSNVLSQGRLDINEVQFSDAGSGIRKGKVRLHLNHDIALDLPGEKLQVKGLEVGFQDIALKSQGQLARFKTGPLEADLRVESNAIKLASVLKEIPPEVAPDLAKLRASGEAFIKAELRGTLDSGKAPPFTADFRLENAEIAHQDVPARFRGGRILAFATADSLEVREFHFEADGNPIDMKARLGSLQAIPFLHALDLKAKVDLGKVVPLLLKMKLIEPGLEASGLVDAAVEAQGLLNPQDPTGLKAAGKISLQDLSVKTPDLPRPLKANGVIDLSNDRITPNLAASFGESEVRIIGTIANYLAMALPEKAGGKNTVVRMTVQSSFLNLDELLGSGPKNKEEAEGPPMTSWPRLPPLDGQVEVRLAKTQYLGLALTNFYATLNLANQTVNITSRGNVYAGLLNQKLRLDLRDSTQAKVDLGLKVTQVEANDFISRLNDRLPPKNRFFSSVAGSDNLLFGKLNLDLDMKTSGLPQTLMNNLTGVVNLVVNEGKVANTGLVKGFSSNLAKVNKSLAFQDLSFSNFKLNLQAAGGKFLVKEARIHESPVGGISALGTIGFDNTLDLVLENRLPQALSKQLSGASTALATGAAQATGIAGLGNISVFPKDAEGRVLLYYAVGGLLSAPTFALDQGKMAKGAKQQAEDALRAELKAKEAELRARAEAEKQKLETEARARVDAEKKKVEERVGEEKKKASEEAKKRGRDALKGIGF